MVAMCCPESEGMREENTCIFSWHIPAPSSSSQASKIHHERGRDSILARSAKGEASGVLLKMHSVHLQVLPQYHENQY